MPTGKRPLQFALIHADESCLGNGQDAPTPGGAGSLIEVRTRGGVARRDVYISSPDTTNNRMALAGAIATFALLAAKGNRFRVVYVSDSEYLTKGMSEWVPAWQARGWRRAGGKVENLELWQKLVPGTAPHQPEQARRLPRQPRHRRRARRHQCRRRAGPRGGDNDAGGPPGGPWARGAVAR